jgi:hypothetical protein
MKTIYKICGIALVLMCSLAVNVEAQNLYVVNEGSNTVGVYGLDGSTINASLISSGLDGPETISFSGTNLFVVNGNVSEDGTVAEYTTSGTTVNASLISDGSAASGVISGTNLFITINNGVGEYTTSGATVNASLISGFDSDYGIAISGTNLFISDFYDGTVGEYTTSGATVNASLISGLDCPVGVTVAGTNLFVANLLGGTVGEYTTSGATINASLISGLNQPQRIAILGTNLFVACGASGIVGEYTISGATVNASLITGLTNPLDVEIGPVSESAPTPQLNIATVGNQSVLFYPASATNYVLQSATNLASANWQTVTDGVPVIAVTVTNSLPARFFRLAPAE